MMMMGGIKKGIHETTWNHDSYDFDYFHYNVNFHENVVKVDNDLDDDLDRNDVHDENCGFI